MNTSRISQETRANFGLFAIIESTRVVLPLKGVECDFTVRGGVAEVRMSQIFRQENPKPLDCEYLFPLPADASVYSCEADINGRIIRAEVREQGEARKLAAEKQAEGFRTALVESERDNLFTLTLGNVQPNDLIIVQIKYFQTLRAFEATHSFEIPLCPGVRYIPGKPLLRSNRGKGIVDDTNEVPDASRISPVRIHADHPDAAYIDIQGRLDADYTDLPSLVSPSHAIEVMQVGGELRLALASRGEVPNHDFALRWSETNSSTVVPRAWLREKGKESYVLLEVRAPRQTATNASQNTAMDFYFLVDRSGSMQGVKWQKAIEALHGCIGVLGAADRAMVTLFQTTFDDFAEAPLPVGDLIKDPQFQSLHAIGADGGTEMAPALRHVLEIAAKHSPGRDKNLILITDAQVGNGAAILDLMKSAPDMAVHCFGIDIALNDALLLALARQQGGTFHSLHPNDDIQAAVTKLGQTLRQPVLLDLCLGEGWECADAKIPNLYAGQVLYLGARAAEGKSLGLTARTPAGERVSFNFQPQPVTQESPYLLFCKTRIQRLLAEGRDRQAIELSASTNLLCRLTAFIAWDESEKVAVSRHELVQPNMELKRNLSMSHPVMKCVRWAALHEETPSLMIRRKSRTGMRQESTSQLAEELIWELLAACRGIGAAELQSFHKVIADWFAQAGHKEISELLLVLERLVNKLNICAQLAKALHSHRPGQEGDLSNHLTTCRSNFEQLRQCGGVPDQDFKVLENFIQSPILGDTAASTGQIESLIKSIQKASIDMARLFTDELLVRK